MNTKHRAVRALSHASASESRANPPTRLHCRSLGQSCLLLLGAVRLTVSCMAAADAASSWAPFVEPAFPFHSSVIDGRRVSTFTNNLTPRGLILNPGGGAWIGFDVDLLRVAAVWHGPGLTPVSMSQGSYQTSGVKAPEGQRALPTPLGSVWLENDIHAGWHCGDPPLLADPREPGPDPREVGRGPLPRSIARFVALHLNQAAPILEYEVGGTTVREAWNWSPHTPTPELARHLWCASSRQTRWLVVGRPNTERGATVRLLAGPETRQLELTNLAHGILAVRIPAAERPVQFALLHAGPLAPDTPGPSPGASAEGRRPQSVADLGANLARPPSASDLGNPAPRRWPESVTTTVQAGNADGAYALDNIELPLANPWRRNVRLADVAFFADGRAAGVTFDGDVWLIDGLGDTGNRARWRRFASGLHEPLSVVVQNNSIVVFDRNGIWRLRDADQNGEADLHELISNAFTQTAETREFATGLRLAPDGAFVVSKGGQQTATIGRHNGTVLRVPADGAAAEVLAYGLRMPFIGVHPISGLVTASDQQGHYVPATPLHRIGDARFYGFISLLLPKEHYPAPIAEPLTWIPHAVNASGAGQVWWTDPRAGALEGALIHLGYYRPELFVVRLHESPKTQLAAVMSLTRNLAFPPLHGAVNPADGQLYVAGFQIWGSEARQIAGLARVRPTGRTFTLPRAVLPMREGVLLQFDSPLDPASAGDAANYSAERWNYRRTAAYGSPHYKLDGAKGQDAMPPARAYLSPDARAVFVAIPDMRPSMQLRLGWTLRMRDGTPSHHNAYLSPAELPAFAPQSFGFPSFEIDLSPRSIAQAPATPPTAAEGRRIAELMGCTACHSTDGTTLGKVGPSWKGLYGSERSFADGSRMRADEAYLRQSIREPAARIVTGFDTSDTGMPSYDGVLTDTQVESLVAYLRTLE